MRSTATLGNVLADSLSYGILGGGVGYLVSHTWRGALIGSSLVAGLRAVESARTAHGRTSTYAWASAILNLGVGFYMSYTQPRAFTADQWVEQYRLPGASDLGVNQVLPQGPTVDVAQVAGLRGLRGGLGYVIR